MLRRFIWSMISLLFIAYVGETSGLSLVGPAFAQVGSGSGGEVTIGTCNPAIQLTGVSNGILIGVKQGNNGSSGGTFEANGVLGSGNNISASDFGACGISNVSIIS